MAENPFGPLKELVGDLKHEAKYWSGEATSGIRNWGRKLMEPRPERDPLSGKSWARMIAKGVETYAKKRSLASAPDTFIPDFNPLIFGGPRHHFTVMPFPVEGAAVIFVKNSLSTEFGAIAVSPDGAEPPKMFNMVEKSGIRTWEPVELTKLPKLRLKSLYHELRRATHYDGVPHDIKAADITTFKQILSAE